MQTGYLGSKICAFAGAAARITPTTGIIKTEKRIGLFLKPRVVAAEQDIIAWLKWCKAMRAF
jgi:hypothetical protein